MSEETEINLGAMHTTAHFSELTNPKQRAFLSAFCIHGRIKKACKASDTPRRNHYFWMTTDENYCAAFYSSRDRICDHIEEGLVNRLANGWKEPVFHNGEVCGYRRKYDNAAALRYLESANPQVFGKQQQMEANELFKPVDLADVRRRLNAQHAARNGGPPVDPSDEPVSDFEANVAETLHAMKNCIEVGPEPVTNFEANLASQLSDMIASVPYAPEPTETTDEN